MFILECSHTLCKVCLYQMPETFPCPISKNISRKAEVKLDEPLIAILQQEVEPVMSPQPEVAKSNKKSAQRHSHMPPSPKPERSAAPKQEASHGPSLQQPQPAVTREIYEESEKSRLQVKYLFENYRTHPLPYKRKTELKELDQLPKYGQADQSDCFSPTKYV